MIRRALFAVVAALLVVACGSTPSASPSGAPEPVADAARDAMFGLALVVDRATLRAGEPITVGASYTYLGPREAERAYHAARAIGYRIEELGGRRGMEGGMEMPCLSTDVVRGRPVTVPFLKAGGISNIPGVGFDRAWYEDPLLRLPAGSWRIVASLDVYLGDCGGEHHPLEAAVRVVVEP